MKSINQYYIEGNIGVGKSTFLKIIQDNIDCQMVFEPHKKWQDVNRAGNLLEQFYKDTKRWAYTFQSYAFITRIIEQELKILENPKKPQIIERSIFSDRYCFAQLIFETKNMNRFEWQIYKEWFNWITKKYINKPSGFIYLRTTPKVCLARLKKRARSEECNVTFNYLEAVHNKHEDWLLKRTNIPVAILDCCADFETNANRQMELLNQIINKFTPQLKLIK